MVHTAMNHEQVSLVQGDIARPELDRETTDEEGSSRSPCLCQFGRADTVRRLLSIVAIAPVIVG
jgi:hypothetical protein